MRIFQTVLLLAFFGASVRCLPLADETTTESAKIEASAATPQETAAIAASPTTARPDASTDYYDQRQNGTENYRIHVDGVVLVFAPVEALLLAGAGGTTESNLTDHVGSSIQAISELSKPSIDGAQNKTDPATSKTIII
ncbi:hypothetical protein X777_12978 [Ooceraea biroi]|uniref:Uncharacterized protein n=1 Tax=Ooceraea biroi TaxID=2015173 RepID=A0A026W030_OOCBI|nr:hypothetical protein X777_12978 [Ooceraea biroi]